PPEEEDLARELLPDLASEVGGAEAAVEARHVEVGLLETRMLAARDREIAHDVQAVAAARRPARDDADDHLRHEPDQTLHLQDVEPACARGIDRLRGVPCRVAVSVPTADALVAAGAERPASVAWRWTVPGDEHAPDVGAHARVVKSAIELVDGLRPERVAYLGPVEPDPDRALVDRSVVRDVLELET